jgi:ABC-type nickel/cobalt efflux system permease component RcnA
MAEGIEVPEAHGEELPYMVPVAVTMSILAVLVAIATLFGHRAATEGLTMETKAADQWAYYQAKNIRLHEMQAVADILDTLAPADKEKAAAVREKYLKEVERYSDEKEDVSDKAKEYEKERDMADRKEDRFDAAEVILEIGLIICSLTLLTRRKMFWYSGVGLGILGTVVMITGFLMKG